MTALVDGGLNQRERDALSHLLTKHDALRGLEWSTVLARADELADDAPLFSDAREDVAKRLTDPERCRFAIALAAEMASADEHVEEEEHAILMTLANSLGIPDEEAQEMVDAAASRDRAGPVRVAFNDPRKTDESSLADAVRKAKTNRHLAALLFKPRAIRGVATQLEQGKVTKVGTRVPIGLHHLRIDGTITHESKQWLVRCVAPGEALHDDEYTVYKMLVEQLDDKTTLVFAHAGELVPADEDFLDSLGSSSKAEIRQIM